MFFVALLSTFFPSTKIQMGNCCVILTLINQYLRKKIVILSIICLFIDNRQIWKNIELMDNTKRVIAIIVIIAMLLGVFAWGEWRVRNVEKESEIALEESELNAVKQAKKANKGEKRIAFLEKEGKTLRDSITLLKREVLRLNRRLGSQGKQILANERKLEKLIMREDSLVKVIARMRENGQIADNTVKGQIDELQEERLEAGRDMVNLLEANRVLKDSVVDVAVDRERLKETLTVQEMIYKIANETTVKFKAIQPKKDNDNKARSPKRWKYTLIDLELNHKEMALLQDEIFVVEIWDLDKNLPLSPREANAGTDTKGETFSFTGNPVKTIRYPNYQDKDSKNYAVKVLYNKNGKQYPLRNGGLQRIDF
jgi:hypothetical protein